jgi:hypothetical protein
VGRQVGIGGAQVALDAVEVAVEGRGEAADVTAREAAERGEEGAERVRIVGIDAAPAAAATTATAAAAAAAAAATTAATTATTAATAATAATSPRPSSMTRVASIAAAARRGMPSRRRPLARARTSPARTTWEASTTVTMRSAIASPTSAPWALSSIDQRPTPTTHHESSRGSSANSA